MTTPTEVVVTADGSSRSSVVARPFSKHYIREGVGENKTAVNRHPSNAINEIIKLGASSSGRRIAKIGSIAANRHPSRDREIRYPQQIAEVIFEILIKCLKSHHAESCCVLCRE